MWYYNSVVNNKHIEREKQIWKKSARTYTITEETLDKVKAEIMEQFEKYAMMGIKAKYNEEILSAINGFQGAAIAASIFVKLAPDDYPVDELIISIITAQIL